VVLRAGPVFSAAVESVLLTVGGLVWLTAAESVLFMVGGLVLLTARTPVLLTAGGAVSKSDNTKILRDLGTNTLWVSKLGHLRELLQLFSPSPEPYAPELGQSTRVGGVATVSLGWRKVRL